MDVMTISKAAPHLVLRPLRRLLVQPLELRQLLLERPNRALNDALRVRLALARKRLLHVVAPNEEAEVLLHGGDARLLARLADALGDAGEERVEPGDLFADGLVGAEEEAEGDAGLPDEVGLEGLVGGRSKDGGQVAEVGWGGDDHVFGEGRAGVQAFEVLAEVDDVVGEVCQLLQGVRIVGEKRVVQRDTAGTSLCLRRKQGETHTSH
jgi:hypothetical protein